MFPLPQHLQELSTVIWMLNSHCLLDSEPFSCGLCFHGFITCLVVSITIMSPALGLLLLFDAGEGLQDIIGL